MKVVMFGATGMTDAAVGAEGAREVPFVVQAFDLCPLTLTFRSGALK
jgi:hypothetical protein